MQTRGYYNIEIVGDFERAMIKKEFPLGQEEWSKKEIVIRRELTSGINKILDLLPIKDRHKDTYY